MKDWRSWHSPGSVFHLPSTHPPPSSLSSHLLVLHLNAAFPALVTGAVGGERAGLHTQHSQAMSAKPSSGKRVPQREMRGGRGSPQILHLTKIALESDGFKETSLCHDNAEKGACENSARCQSFDWTSKGDNAATDRGATKRKENLENGKKERDGEGGTVVRGQHLFPVLYKL